MKISLLGVSILAVMLASIAGGEVIYTNDFGTEAQLNSFAWVGDYGIGTAGLRLYGPGTGVMDLDGDGLYQMAVQNSTDGWGGSTGTLSVYAPLYSKITITGVSAYLAGHPSPSHGSSATLAMSGNGVDYQSITDDRTNVIKQYTIVPSPTDPNFIATDKVWLGLTLASPNPGTPEWYWGRAAAVQLEGTIIPGGIGDHVTIFSNDLGTDEQAAEWLISGFIERQDLPGFDTNADGASGRFFRYQAGNCWAMLKVEAPFGLAFAYPVAECTGYRSSSQGTGSTIAMSLNGKDWVSSSVGPGNGVVDLVADSAGQAGWAVVEEFWLQVRLDGLNNVAVWYQPWARSIMSHADLVAAPAHYCGEAGTVYPDGDITGTSGVRDCYVNLIDLAQLAAQWLEENDPYTAP